MSYTTGNILLTVATFASLRQLRRFTCLYRQQSQNLPDNSLIESILFKETHRIENAVRTPEL